jgi:hypothetical protein
MDLRLSSIVAVASVSAGLIAFGVLTANALEPKTDASTLSISESDATLPAVAEAGIPQLSSGSASDSRGLERAAVQLADVTEVPPVLADNSAVPKDIQSPARVRNDALRLSLDRGRLPAKLHSSHVRSRPVLEARFVAPREEHRVPRMALVLGVAF